ncbi:hypothetical protein AM596_15645 [Clostridium perfringens CP4]|uniref:hypothetical protein n=1 Tax=Clostridium perfringens TaxID=1502 RepID=UPI000707DC34|nr:hypothetical protein [Clostridium perfringens]KQC91251.1 hypothetical protein AM596_15645 [Clostridium perfringens CP4]MBO3398466.1 hypothetical protein [Clostridium perfringens]
MKITETIKSLKEEIEDLKKQLEITKSERDQFKEIADRNAIKVMKYEKLIKDITERLKEY